jgi:hypothetical protein
LQYEVTFTEPASKDADDYVLLIRERSNDAVASDNWWNGLLDAIFSLESLPGRCPLIPEQENFDYKVHQLLYASHRIIFEIEPGKVTVLRVYHSSQKRLTPSRLRRSQRRADLA